MVAVAIYSVDPALRLRLEQLLRAELRYTVASVTHDPAAVSRLIEQSRVDTVVAHAPSREQLTDWRNRHPATTFVVIAGESDGGKLSTRSTPAPAPSCRPGPRAPRSPLRSIWQGVASHSYRVTFSSGCSTPVHRQRRNRCATTAPAGFRSRRASMRCWPPWPMAPPIR
jgi:hypothetical protein